LPQLAHLSLLSRRLVSDPAGVAAALHVPALMAAARALPGAGEPGGRHEAARELRKGLLGIVHAAGLAARCCRRCPARR
jgi:hypothetical protein